MSNMEAMRTEQNSLGLVEGPTPLLDVYEIRPRKDRDGFDLISDRLRYGPIWYTGPDAIRYAVAYAKYRSRSRAHRAIIRVFNERGQRDRDARAIGCRLSYCRGVLGCCRRKSRRATLHCSLR
jgi:hypothetical protein